MVACTQSYRFANCLSDDVEVAFEACLDPEDEVLGFFEALVNPLEALIDLSEALVSCSESDLLAPLELEEVPACSSRQHDLCRVGIQLIPPAHPSAGRICQSSRLGRLQKLIGQRPNDPMTK